MQVGFFNLLDFRENQTVIFMNTNFLSGGVFLLRETIFVCFRSSTRFAHVVSVLHHVSFWRNSLHCSLARVLLFDSLGSCLRYAQGIINEGFGQRGAFADIQEVKTDLTHLPPLPIRSDPHHLAGD